MKLQAKYPHGLFVFTGPNPAYFSKGIIFGFEHFEPIDEERAKEIAGKQGWLLVKTQKLGLGWVNALLIEEVE